MGAAEREVSGIASWTAFSLPGNWYRGNLHCHSTNSDGARDPADVVSYYRDRGYAFLVLSDHRRVSDLSASASPGFVPIEGMEIDGHDPLVNGPFHMLAIGLRDLREQLRGAPRSCSSKRSLRTVA